MNFCQWKKTHTALNSPLMTSSIGTRRGGKEYDDEEGCLSIVVDEDLGICQLVDTSTQVPNTTTTITMCYFEYDYYAFFLTFSRLSEHCQHHSLPHPGKACLPSREAKWCNTYNKQYTTASCPSINSRGAWPIRRPVVDTCESLAPLHL